MKKKVNKRAKKDECCETCGSWMNGCCGGKKSGGCGGCAYFLGVIGAATYYISSTTGFWAGVLGILKALVWPAFVVYHLLGL